MPDLQKDELHGITEAPKWQKRRQRTGRLEFLERWPGLLAVVDALECELNIINRPGSAVSQKWMSDLSNWQFPDLPRFALNMRRRPRRCEIWM